MRKLSFLILLFFIALATQSCSTVFSSAGNNNVIKDSTTFTNRSIVGTSNTPGSPRIVDYQELKLGTGATPNTTGPSLSPQELAAYENPEINKINGVSVVDMKRLIQLVTYNRLTEMQISAMMSSKTKNTAISNYALNLIKEQNGMGDELKAIAAAKRLSIEDLTSKESNDLTEKIDKLNKSSAEELNQVYIKLVRKEHKNAIEILSQGAKFKDNAISVFSTKYLSVFRAQLKKLESL